MEWTESTALKQSAFLQEKTNSQAFYNDDVLCLGGNNNISSDDFPVEDTFNFDLFELENEFQYFSPEAVQFDTIGQLLLQTDKLENTEHDIRSEPVNIPVPKKPRSKRSRPRGRSWSTLLTTSAQGQKRKPGAVGGPIIERICLHCHVKKTSMWRTGPQGAKTLCNACGVRYRSGRLFPEYKPACSPIFSPEMHSNSHRKVLEMRRAKKMHNVDKPNSV